MKIEHNGSWHEIMVGIDSWYLSFICFQTSGPKKAVWYIFLYVEHSALLMNSIDKDICKNPFYYVTTSVLWHKRGIFQNFNLIISHPILMCFYAERRLLMIHSFFYFLLLLKNDVFSSSLHPIVCWRAQSLIYVICVCLC